MFSVHTRFQKMQGGSALGGSALAVSFVWYLVYPYIYKCAGKLAAKGLSPSPFVSPWNLLARGTLRTFIPIVKNLKNYKHETV